MRFLLISLPLVLAACGGSGPVPASNPSPEAAAEFSDDTVNAMANCVRINATDAELALLDQGGQLAQSATTSILQRPATGDCIVASGVTLDRAS